MTWHTVATVHGNGLDSQAEVADALASKDEAQRQWLNDTCRREREAAKLRRQANARIREG